MMCGWLSCLGANVRQAASSAEALELLAESRFDLVVTDVRASASDAALLVATMRYLALDTPCLMFEDIRARPDGLAPALVVPTPSSLPIFARHARRVLAMRSRSARHHHRP